VSGCVCRVAHPIVMTAELRNQKQVVKKYRGEAQSL
jgi:hypothetical protein